MKSLYSSGEYILAVSGATCDRCGSAMPAGSAQFRESISIDKLCGSSSIFGNGKLLRLDLCERCLQEVLGPWLRVIEPISTAQVHRYGQFIQLVQNAFRNDQSAIDSWMDKHCEELGGESPHAYLERTGDVEQIEKLLTNLH